MIRDVLNTFPLFPGFIGAQKNRMANLLTLFVHNCSPSHAKFQGHASYAKICSTDIFSVSLHSLPFSSTTNNISMLTLTQDDHDTFKGLNNPCPDIKKAIIPLAGKKKKGEDPEMDIHDED